MPSMSKSFHDLFHSDFHVSSHITLHRSQMSHVKKRSPHQGTAKIVARGTTGYSFSLFCPLMLYVWTFGILNFEKIWEHPPIFTWVLAYVAPAGCPSQFGNLGITSIILAAVIWVADDHRSVIGSRVVFHSVSSEHDYASILL